MDTSEVSVNAVFVARSALLGSNFLGTLDLMRLAMTVSARLLPQDAVNTLRNLRDGFVVAGGAGNARHVFGMGIVLDADVAGGAAEFAVHAGLVASGVHVQAASGFRFQPRISMTTQTILVGGLRRKAQQERCCQC